MILTPSIICPNATTFLPYIPYLMLIFFRTVLQGIACDWWETASFPLRRLWGWSTCPNQKTKREWTHQVLYLMLRFHSIVQLGLTRLTWNCSFLVFHCGLYLVSGTFLKKITSAATVLLSLSLNTVHLYSVHFHLGFLSQRKILLSLPAWC